jgi:hypothetical protein
MPALPFKRRGLSRRSSGEPAMRPGAPRFFFPVLRPRASSVQPSNIGTRKQPTSFRATSYDVVGSPS